MYRWKAPAFRGSGLKVIALALLLRAPQANGQDERVYFGILHSHTGYSDGSGLPPDAYTRARTKGKCDFFAITEHNHGDNISPEDGAPRAQIIALAPQNYNGGSKSLALAAQNATVPGQFVALYGQEFSTISSGNHVNVFDVPNVINVQSGQFDDLLEWIRDPAHFDTTQQPAIVQFNHPSTQERNDRQEYGMDDFGSEENWIRQMGQLACTIEVLNGPGTKPEPQPIPSPQQAAYFHYLSLGFRLAPSADHDNHFKTWGTLTTARTGVIAKELTKPALLAALRARHAYATTDTNLQVIIRVNGALTGDVVPPPAADSVMPFEIRITDGDEPNAKYTIEPHTGVSGSREPPIQLDAFHVQGNGTHSPGHVLFETDGQYVLFVIRQTNAGGGSSDRVWTAPVWFQSSAFGGTSGGTFIASKNSSLFHSNPQCPAARAIVDANRLTGDAARNGRSPHACPPVQ